MGTLIFSFLIGNKSRPQFKCNLTYIPGFFSGINFFIPNRNIFLKKITAGLGFEFCVFVAGWRHALLSEWPFIIIII